MKNQKILYVLVTLVLVLGGALYLSSKSHAPFQTVNPMPSRPVQKSGWKQFENNNYNFGVSFSYPTDWKVSQGNTGPIFASPDQKLILSISGPLINDTDTIEKLSLRTGTNSQVISKSDSKILGHPAIRQELLSSSGSETIDSINEYIGNVKNISRWKDGSPNIEYGTIILGITILDKAQYDKAVTIFNQIVSSIKFVN